MTYKDKQREADRARQKRRRDRIKAKGVTRTLPHRQQGVTNQGVTQGVTSHGITEPRVLPPPGLPTLDEPLTDNTTKRGKGIIDAKIANGTIFNNGEPSPPSEPRDEQVFPKTTRFPTHNRGKDIKCFADLHPGIQQTIDRLSLIDKTIKANRTAIAINYQHLFPERYASQVGVVGNAGIVITGKPGDAE